MKPLCLFIALAMITGASCAHKSKSGFSDSAKVSRIKVASDGRIFLNGVPATLEEVKNNFAQLKGNKGTVRYYRENPQDDPPAQALNVLHAIADARLPIRLCISEEELNGTQ
jgi:hypothetical protein